MCHMNRGTCHQSVTDFQFLCNLAVGRLMEVRYKLDPHSCMDLSCRATLGFLWKHLGTWLWLCILTHTITQRQRKGLSVPIERLLLAHKYIYYWLDCLVGLVVKVPASRAEDPGFKSCLRWDFFGSSPTNDLKIDTPVATLLGAWRYRVNAGTGWPSISIL